MIDLENKYLLQLKAILAEHIPSQKIILFGSRANGTAKPYSDIDLAIMDDEPLETLTLAKLRMGFEESDLPYKVDIVEWSELTDAFKAAIQSGQIEVL